MQLLFALLSQRLAATNTQKGQSTVEYVLVTLGAAMIAMALIRVAGGLNRIAEVFNKVIDSVLGLF